MRRRRICTTLSGRPWKPGTRGPSSERSSGSHDRPRTSASASGSRGRARASTLVQRRTSLNAMATSHALRIVASRPDPAIITLPWSLPLEEWTEHVVPLPRGLSRHVVRIVRLGARTYAVKETVETMAFREYRLLRDLQR